MTDKEPAEKELVEGEEVEEAEKKP